MGHFPFWGPTQGSVSAGMGGCDEGRVVEVVYGEINPAGTLPTSASANSQPSSVQTLPLMVKPARRSPVRLGRAPLGRDVQPQRALSRWLCDTPESCLPCS